MGINVQEFLNDKIIGNIRSGARSENGTPKKLEYFDVHTDKSTSETAVEIFKQKFEKPNKLKIRFIKQNPIDLHLERYDGRKRRCIGDNKKAEFIDDSGKKRIIECNAKECKYKRDKICKYKARLYFLIEGLESEGIWCYPIGSEKGIRHICTMIGRANRLNEDLTKNWYELYLEPEDAPFKGINYIPDIRKLEAINLDDKTNKVEQKPKEEKSNYLLLKSFMMTIYKDKKIPKIKFINTSGKEIEYILLENSKQDILKLKPESIILPLKIEKTEKGILLIDYKIIRAISNEIENKKAV